MQLKANPWQKVHKTPSQPIAGYSGSLLSSQVFRIVIQAVPTIKQDPISKITKAERAEGMAQVADHLLSKHKAPSSNFSTTK
jgi:hypothetical protein